jgi:hypothetical protein
VVRLGPHFSPIPLQWECIDGHGLHRLEALPALSVSKCATLLLGPSSPCLAQALQAQPSPPPRPSTWLLSTLLEAGRTGHENR